MYSVRLNQSQKQKVRRWAPYGAALVVFVVIAYLSGLSAYRSVSSFDGAMNLQVPINLIKEHSYATNYGSLVEFDHKIQTGPTVLVPIALSIGLFGKTFFAAGLVNLLYLLGFFVVLYLFVRRLVGPWWAVLAVSLVFVTPRILNIGLNQYGEIPALFFALSAALLLDRVHKAAHPGRTALVAGLLLGTAVLTKTVMLIAVPSFVALAMLDRLTTKRIVWKHYALFFAVSPLPYLLFETYKLSQLGWGAYKNWWRDELGAVSNQAGVAEGTFADTPGLWEKFQTHFEILANEFNVDKALLVALLVLPMVVVLYKLAQLWKQKRQFSWPLSFFFVAGLAYSYFGWWLLITPTARAWHRRILDGFILQEVLLVLTVAVVVGLLSHLHRRSTKGLVALVAIAAAVTILYEFAVLTPRFEKQIHPKTIGETVAHFGDLIYQLPADAKIYGTGWWQSPRFSFLSGRTFLSVNHQTPPIGPLTNSYFTIEREAWALSRAEMERTLSWFDHELIERADSGDGEYFLYKLNHFYGPTQ